MTQVTTIQPDVFDAATTCGWYVLHTRPRQEKTVAADLQAMGLPHFLPLVRHTRVHGHRKNVVDLPLFPGYVFLRGQKDDAYRADRTGRIVHILDVPNQEHLHWELSNIKLALEQQVPLDPFPYLKVGIRAEVRAGPMRGLQGLIESRGKRDRLVLQVDMLGRAVSIEVDGSLLEPME